MSTQIQKQSFGVFQTVAAGANVSQAVIIPKGTKAVLTSLTLASAGTVSGGTAMVALVTASGGQTGILARVSNAIAAATVGTKTLQNEGHPISGVIDATTAAVTLTLTSTAAGADALSAGFSGEYIT